MQFVREHKIIALCQYDIFELEVVLVSVALEFLANRQFGRMPIYAEEFPKLGFA